MVVNGLDLAKCLKLTPARVSQLTKSGIIKRDQDGKFNLSCAVEDYYRYKFKTDEELNYQREHTMLEKAKREMAELKLSQLKDSLLYATDVEQAMHDIIKVARSKLLPIAPRCATKVIGENSLPSIVYAIQGEIYQALNELKGMPAPPVEESEIIYTKEAVK